MKHLAVLEAAGLVVARKSGRERWNHLNAVPIQQIYTRWVQPYAAGWSGALVNLKSHTESRTMGGSMPAARKSRAEFGVVEVELEITIQAKPSKVWKALVSETSRWWRKDFFTSPAAKGFVIEPKLGGRVYEDWGDGSGLMWYTVAGIDPQRSLSLQGHLTSAFGGPASTLLQIQLEAAGATTVVRISDTIFGRVTDEKLAQTREGWKLLFDSGLRAHVEGA
jgi:uncharacterized protein YndB with AHSA1/START domain